MNETHASVTKNSATRQRVVGLEGRLRRVRVAIKEAKFQNKTQDADYIPNGPMYWNANAFHRYLPLQFEELLLYIYKRSET